MKKKHFLICILALVAGSAVLAYTTSYSVQVIKEEGRNIRHGGDDGFAWRNLVLSVNGDEVSGSLDLKVWDNKTTPVSQVFIAVGRKIWPDKTCCLFNRVPRNESDEAYRRVKFSFSINYPTPGINYDVNLGQTFTMSEEAGRSHFENEKGGVVQKIGILSTH